MHLFLRPGREQGPALGDPSEVRQPDMDLAPAGLRISARTVALTATSGAESESRREMTPGSMRDTRLAVILLSFCS